MKSMPPGTGPLSPDFTGIDPDLMDRFIDEMEHAQGVIGENTEAIRRVFAANGMSALSLAPIGEIEAWLGEQLPGLRQRNQMVRDMAKLPSWSPGGLTRLVAYNEKLVLSPAAARRLGQELADRYKEIDPNPFLDFAPGLDEKYQKIVDELAAHMVDPQFTAAFFAGLGERRTLELPDRLRRWLPEGGTAAVDTVSRAFGSAMSGAATAAGFAAIAKAVQDKADNSDDQAAIGDLLSAGRFPTEWLAQTVVNQVLVPGNMTARSALTPYLNALANNPSAARLAISLASRDSPLPKVTLPDNALAAGFPLMARQIPAVDRRPDLVGLLKDLNGRAAADDTSADAFGRLLAAASGAYDEADDKHSDQAARFAYTVITTVDDMNLAPPTRIHLAEIGGSYAAEITEGANIEDSNMTEPSAFTPVYAKASGLASAFRLSMKDTYRFLKTFADSPENLAHFDDGMGRLTQRLFTEGSKKVLQSKNVDLLDNAFKALGSARGFEMAAAETVQGNLDSIDEQREKINGLILDSALGVGGFFVPFEQAGQVAWFALSTGFSANDALSSVPDTRVNRNTKANRALALGRQHVIADSLMANGFPAKVTPAEFQAQCPPGVAIADANGNLRPFPEIRKSGNAGLEAFERWASQNGMGTEEKLALGRLSAQLADDFQGPEGRALPRALAFDE